jgi:hypothetical protein
VQIRESAPFSIVGCWCFMPLLINGEIPKSPPPIFKRIEPKPRRTKSHRAKPVFHGWDSYSYVNLAVGYRLISGFNVLLWSEREGRAPYTRMSEHLVLPEDDPESAAAEEVLESILEEDPPPLDCEG